MVTEQHCELGVRRALEDARVIRTENTQREQRGGKLARV